MDRDGPDGWYAPILAEPIHGDDAADPGDRPSPTPRAGRYHEQSRRKMSTNAEAEVRDQRDEGPRGDPCPREREWGWR